jgi:hypothetical protein
LIHEIAMTPANLRSAVEGLTEQQLDTPYREGGWTVRQVVHHLADSHMQSFGRVRFALSQDTPTIMPYPEAIWAEYADSRSAPVETSLRLIESLHERWVILWRSLSPEQFSRKLIHPESGTLTLDNILEIYSWHGRHHTAHITRLRERAGF